MLCYASGIDEPEAVRETVAILKQADLAPLDVAGHGTIEDRLKDGEEIAEEELELMERAEKENSVIIAQMTLFLKIEKNAQNSFIRFRWHLIKLWVSHYQVNKLRLNKYGSQKT